MILNGLINIEVSHRNIGNTNNHKMKTSSYIGILTLWMTEIWHGESTNQTLYFI